MTQDEKIEPKFKVGDWVVDKNGIVRQILSYKDGIYKHTDGYSAEIFEDEWRMWTIKDAKDGDVLATDDGNIFVFDGTVEDDKYPFAYYGLTRRRFESYDRRLPFTHNNIHPATKEQRDQLEKAMADAGYKWNEEERKLEKIEQNPANKIEPDILIEESYQQQADDLIDMVTEKPAWSEEDENRFNNLIFLVECSDENEPTKKGFIDFINRLKSTIHQRHWKPSNEQMDVLDEVIRNGSCT